MVEQRARIIYANEEIALILIQSDSRWRRQDRTSLQWWATLFPVALVIRDASGIRAIDMANQPVDVQRLTREVPELARLIH